MYPFTELVASRTLTGKSGVVTLELGKPLQDSDGPDWFCPWRVSGLTDGDIESFTGGVDSVQALIFALAAIGDLVESEKDENFRFVDTPHLGLLRTVATTNDVWQAAVNYPAVF